MGVMYVTTATKAAAAGGGGAFNGGKTQMGLNFLGQSGSGDYPFMNAIKTLQGWTYTDNSDVPAPSELDANGWPLSTSAAIVSHGGVYNVTFVPTQGERSGKYVATWTGNGTIIQNSTATFVSGSKTSTTGSGRYEFIPTDNRVSIGIASGSITDLTLFHHLDETALGAGKIFNTKFIDTIVASNVGVVRFLDWQNANNTMVTNWASRKPVSYYSYAADEYRNNIYLGSTGGSGDAYTASVPGTYIYGDSPTYADKQMAIVRFDRAGTTNTPTFKIGTGPAKTIQSYYAQTLTTNGRPALNKYALLIFDQSLDVWIKLAGDANQGSRFLTNFVPPEICVALCAEAGAHPYIMLPYMAADPLSDWAPSYATYIRDNGPSWMIPRFEGCNELWHASNITQFPASGYAWAKANVRNATAAGSFSPTAVTYTGHGSTGFTTITFAAPHSFSVGAFVSVTGFNGTPNWFGFNGSAFVTSVPDANTIVINVATTSTATWTPGTGAVAGVLNDNVGWSGRSNAALGQAISAVYGDNRSRYHVICGVQTGGTTASQTDRLKATQYKLQGGDYGYNWITHVATAQYWAPSSVGSFAETINAFDYFYTYAGNASQQDILMTAYLASNTLAALNTMYQGWYSWANSFGVSISHCGYEGGYSPDYSPYPTYSPVTGATVASGTTVDLTLATTGMNNIAPVAGNPAKAGMYLKITGVGGMTQLNGNTYPIAGVAGNIITITVPSTAGFGAWTSGGSAEYFGDNLGNTITAVTNRLRFQSKYHSTLTALTAANLANFKASGANSVFPSHFLLSAATVFSNGYATSGQIWSIYDPDIYATPSTALAAIIAYA